MSTPSNPDDIEQWLRNKFPNLQRKFSSPSLATINGVGPRFVGRRDFDAETASWVTTQYFCVVFIPIFAMACYRVTAASGGGWHILGREPLSGRQRGMNYLLLALVAGGIGASRWSDYVNSPDYRAKKAIAAAVSAREAGRPDEAMRHYFEVLGESGTTRKDEARAGYASSFDAALESLPLPKKLVAIKDALISRSMEPAPVADISARVLGYVQKGGGLDAAGASALLKAALPAVPASDMVPYRSAWKGFLEKAVAAEPGSVDHAVSLAVILDAEDKPEECRKLLTPHAAKLGNTDGARVLGQILVRDGQFSEGVPLLKAYAESRLKTLHSAESRFEKTMKRVQQEALEGLQKNKGPASFYRSYESATEDGKQTLVDDYIAGQIKQSREAASALADLEAANPVVSVMLSLGIAQLNLAQQMTDAAARRKGMEEAEASFLSVQKSASGTDEYRLFMGQVAYWLGKHDEGRKLLDEFTESGGGKVEKRLMVAKVLRQVGAMDESRSACEKAFAETSDAQLKARAAELRALVYKDADDRIYWLSRAGGGKDVQISLSEAKGQKKMESGDRVGAEQLFREALAGYDDLPKNAATLNNSANMLSQLYHLANKSEYFKEAVNRREESLRLNGQDTVLMENLVTEWQTLLSIEAAEVPGGPDLKGLPSAAASVVARLLPKNDTELKAGRERTRSSETFRKARALADQLLVLAPKSMSSIAGAGSLAATVDDRDALKSLRDRAVAANFNHESEWQDSKKYWSGEKDADFRKNLRSRLDEWTTALKALPDSAHPLAKIACRMTIVGLKRSLSHIGEPADTKALVVEADELARLYPCLPTLRLAQDLHIEAMLEEATRKDAKLADWAKPCWRPLSAEDIFVLALDAKLAVADAANPHFKAWQSLRAKALAAYPKARRSSDWALLRHFDAAQADEERSALEKDPDRLIDSELDWLLSPANAGDTVEAVWREQMLGHKEKAASIWKESKAHGMPLPDIGLGS